MPITTSRSLTVRGLDATTLAWVAAVGGGNVTAGRQVLVNSFIVGLKGDGVWVKLDRVWLLAAENTASALVDLVVNDVASTAVASPTFTTDRGYAGNGTTQYLDTTYKPSTDAIHYSLNSASLTLWNNTSRAADATIQMGGDDGVATASLSSFSSTGSSLRFILNSETVLANPAVAGSQGCGTVNRNGSTSTDVQGYYNGVVLTGATSQTTVAVPTTNFFICGISVNGLFAGGTTDQISAAIIGGSLTATDAGNLYSRLRTYMTAVGVS